MAKASATTAGSRKNGDRIVGDGGDNLLFGTSDDELIFGRGGDDLLDGGSGSDIVDGGRADDLLIFTLPVIIHYISSFTALSPGDVIATGTPGGVGSRRDPPVDMKPGDRIEVEITGIGTLAHAIAGE